MKTVKSQWKAVEPTRCEAQYYSNNADERGEYRICRIDVVVVANKAERERTAEMDGDCCCSLTRRADFDFRRLEKRSGIRAGWTPNFERLGSGWRISILRVCCVCCLMNITTSPIVCLSLVSPSCWSNACVYASCTTQVVQGLHGNDGSRSSRRSRSSQRQRFQVGCRGGDQVFMTAATRAATVVQDLCLAILRGTHIYPLPVALFPPLY